MPKGTCTIEGCERPLKGRGFCNTHLERLRKHGTTDLIVRSPQSCGVPGCERPFHAKGYCSAHIGRLERYGDLRIDVPVGGVSWQERFWAKVNKEGALSEYRPDLGPCWEWLAVLSEPKPMGYGRFFFGKVSRPAHQLAYELLIGPIPEGLELDHLCRVRHCVNPAHLEPVTQGENIRRGWQARAELGLRVPRDHKAYKAEWQRKKALDPEWRARRAAKAAVYERNRRATDSKWRERKNAENRARYKRRKDRDQSIGDSAR